MSRSRQIMALYEDNHILILEKPAGVLVHADRSGDYTLLEAGKEYLKKTRNKPGDVFLKPVHRIDRPASGCQIFACTSKGLSRMNQLFRDRAISKEYFCLSTGDPIVESSELVHWIKKDTERNKSRVKKPDPRKKIPSNWQVAKLKLELCGSSGNHHLYRIVLETGRPHQIRAQMAAVGAPLVGDLKYGGEKWQHKNAIALHCFRMEFEHPVSGEQISVNCLPHGQAWEFFIPLIRDQL
ncbi:MAG: RluA family pseudouridine synthase [Saprospirales bacterium]|nr:MAG: RluA family pseudouridine synthase [Saprospirales bacterium]